MTEAEKAAMKGAAVALLLSYLVYRFAPIQPVKACALGVMGVIVAKQIPYVKDAI